MHQSVELIDAPPYLRQRSNMRPVCMWWVCIAINYLRIIRTCDAQLHLNLYIAITQALVGLVTSLLEYQRLETTIVSLNNSVRDLSHLLVR